MNIAPGSSTTLAADHPPPRKTLVWDAPVRVLHWLMVLSFVGAYVSAESERWRGLHVTLGYTMAGLVLCRIAWGLVGTRHARFGSFVRGPAAVKRYLRSLLHGRPEHHVGHNPAGALAILGMLALSLATAASGWALHTHLGGHTLEEVHEASASLLLGLVGLHVAAVLLSSWLHHENLIGAMVDGRKAAPADAGVPGARRSVAGLVLAAVLAFWWWQWQSPPSPASASDTAAASPGRADDDHDHD